MSTYDPAALECLAAIVEEGGFERAAQRLNVTQSAVSLRILRLEDQLGRPLFERTKAGVVLTAAGREFRGFATMILRNWEQARQRVSALDERARNKPPRAFREIYQLLPEPSSPATLAPAA